MRDYKVKTIDALDRGLLVLDTLHDMHAASLHDLNRETICAGGQVLGCVNLTWRMSVLTIDRVVERHLADLRGAVASIERKVTVAHGTDLKTRILNGNGTTPVALTEPTLASS
jgi:hypothetical protein